MTWSPKKIDKLEVRLSPDAKESFLAHCQAQGRSASEVVRALIQERLARNLKLRDLPIFVQVAVAIGGVAAVGLSTVSLVSAAVAIRGDLRLGLVLFLAAQSVMYALAAAAFFKPRWRDLAALLTGQCLMQGVFGAEVTPPASAGDAALGILVGMLSPTLALVVAAVLAASWLRYRSPGVPGYNG